MMKHFIFIALVLLSSIYSQSCGGSSCDDLSCCLCNQDPNPTDGNGYQEFNQSCLEGGLDCVGNTGCQLCWRPVFGATNVGNRPICDRFSNLTEWATCNDTDCCVDNQQDDGVYLEYNETCGMNDTNSNDTDWKNLNCYSNTGCQYCWRPVFGVPNNGNLSICDRFKDITIDTTCDDDECCLDNQNPNPTNGNGYLEYDPTCVDGGLNCVDDTGCKLCWKPVVGAVNVGNRPICDRFTNSTSNSTTNSTTNSTNPGSSNSTTNSTNPGSSNSTTNSTGTCNDTLCCQDIQDPNPTNGNGYQEFNESCLEGGLNCVGNSGCQLCWRPVYLAMNVGNRPICERFANSTSNSTTNSTTNSTNPGNGSNSTTNSTNGSNPTSNSTNANGQCLDTSCCINNQFPDPTIGIGYLQYNASCLNNDDDLDDCIDGTGCQLCYKPTFGNIVIGNISVCQRFADLTAACYDDQCCMDEQTALVGNGYLEFNQTCLEGGLNCIGTTGCQLCFDPTIGSINIGNRPICTRFS